MSRDHYTDTQRLAMELERVGDLLARIAVVLERAFPEPEEKP